jgi:hypothetical protein
MSRRKNRPFNWVFVWQEAMTAKTSFAAIWGRQKLEDKGKRGNCDAPEAKFTKTLFVFAKQK